MRSALSIIRSKWLAARTYRLRMLLSIVSLLVTVVPLYFIASALQPVMADKIVHEGNQYFGFLVLGTITFMLLPIAVNGLAGEVGSGISTGVLEAMLSTSARLPSILGGLIGFSLIWTAIRGLVMLVGAWVLGATIIWSQLLPAALILGLIVLAYVPLGMITAAMVIAFRTAGPLPQAVVALSGLLGGVYYPTQVIPSWMESISDFVPLTYGLRALRLTLMEGHSLPSVASDLGILVLFIVTLGAAGTLALQLAMGYARRSGTLSHY